jgi:hypothetical protein
MKNGHTVTKILDRTWKLFLKGNHGISESHDVVFDFMFKELTPQEISHDPLCVRLVAIVSNKDNFRSKDLLLDPLVKFNDGFFSICRLVLWAFYFCKVSRQSENKKCRAYL